MMFGCDCVERALNRGFRRYGRFVARHPLPFIILPVLAAAVCAVGFLFFQHNTNIEYLFNEESGQIKSSEEFMKEHYPHTRDNLKNFLRVTVIGKTNLWTEATMKDVLELDKYIRKHEVEEPESEESLTFDSVCELDKQTTECGTNPVLAIIGYNTSMVPLVTLQFPYHPLQVGPGLEPIKLFLGLLLGGVTTNSSKEANEPITSVRAMYLLYQTSTNQTGTEVWERGVRDSLLNGGFSSQHFNITVMSGTSFEDEIAVLSESVMPYFMVTFSVLLSFAVFVTLSTDWVIAKPWLSVGGIVSAMFAIGSGMGLVLFFVPFIDIVSIVPFLGLGVGLDDMFVMVSSWRRTDPRQSVEDRMGEALADAAASITITTLTNVLAIGTGAVADIPAVRYFCIFSFVVISLDYVYQITFFAGCMVYSGRREAAAMHALTCRKATHPKDAENRSWCFRMWCTGGKHLHDDNPESHVWAMKFFREHYGPFLTRVPTKVCVCLFYALYIGCAIYGCLGVREGLELYRVVADDSYVADDIAATDAYFKLAYDVPVNVVLKDRLSFWLHSDRQRVDEMIAEFENKSFFHGRDVNMVWTREFERFIQITNKTVKEENFMAVLQQEFLMLPRYSQYSSDIEIEDNKVVTTRYHILLKNQTKPRHKTDALEQALQVVSSTSLDIDVYSEFFLYYESWLAVMPTLIQNFAIATGAVIVVCLLLIPNPLCSLYVALSIISICIGIMGYMTFWDINVDSVSMINIIMAVGFSVDFSAHITYAFTMATGDSKDERVHDALYSLGVPITQSALSTILGMLVLCNGFAYIFRVFFVTMFLTMVFGCLHGLVFLPVVLSVIGPPKQCCRDRHSGVPTKNNDDHKWPVNGHKALHNGKHNGLTSNSMRYDITSPHWSQTPANGQVVTPDYINPVILSPSQPATSNGYVVDPSKDVDIVNPVVYIDRTANNRAIVTQKQSSLVLKVPTSPSSSVWSHSAPTSVSQRYKSSPSVSVLQTNSMHNSVPQKLKNSPSEGRMSDSQTDLIGRDSRNGQKHHSFSAYELNGFTNMGEDDFDREMFNQGGGDTTVYSWSTEM